MDNKNYIDVPEHTEAKMIVSISGAWLESGKQVSQHKIEKKVREALKKEFEFLADKITVRRIKEDKNAFSMD